MDPACSICGAHRDVMATVTVTVDAPMPVGLVKWHKRVCLACLLEGQRQDAQDAK